MQKALWRHDSFTNVAFRWLVCGADRIRTGDLRLARAAFSQLNYSPVLSVSMR